MCKECNRTYGLNVVANGRNWNSLRLLTGIGRERRGHRLVAIDFRFTGTGMTVILKKDTPTGPMVAFLNASNLDDALYATAAAVKSKTIQWKPDKFRTMRSDKT